MSRTAAYLVERGSDATEAERDAYEARKETLLTKNGEVVTLAEAIHCGANAATGPGAMRPESGAGLGRII